MRRSTAGAEAAAAQHPGDILSGHPSGLRSECSRSPADCKDVAVATALQRVSWSHCFGAPSEHMLPVKLPTQVNMHFADLRVDCFLHITEQQHCSSMIVL